MVSIEQPVMEFSADGGGPLPDEVMQSEQPMVLRNFVADWPLVEAAKESPDAVDAYLRRFYNRTPVTVSSGPPDIDGRIFYSDDLSEFNFRMHRTRLDRVLDELKLHRNDDNPPVHYIGSTTVDYILPGLRDENDVDFSGMEPLASIWIGNQTLIAAHYDVPDNLACVVAGRRRFTLFPPDQLRNLYVGPLDFTPAGQAISMVNLREPDLEKYPKFRTALQHAQQTEMEPGDALFIPSMWWHSVEGLECLNVLINYWWRRSPAWVGNPMDVLNHALLSVRDLPDEQRRAWKEIFSYYVFEPDEEITAHIPEDKRGQLAPIDELTARRLRGALLKRLNR